MRWRKGRVDSRHTPEIVVIVCGVHPNAAYDSSFNAASLFCLMLPIQRCCYWYVSLSGSVIQTAANVSS